MLLVFKSVSGLAQRLQSARRVVVVGNGGIALELVHTVNSRHFIRSLLHIYYVMKMGCVLM
jgi:hypothetical protein